MKSGKKETVEKPIPNKYEFRLLIVMAKDKMNDKLQFVTNELWILAWAASVNKFREDVIKFLTERIMPQYVDGCTEEQHCRNIDSLIAYPNEVDPGILGEAGYKYGVAQKLLNLALKYHWCLGLVSEPPLCPIDRTIISKTRHSGKINWTQITKRSEYKEVVEEVKVLAGGKGLSIPQWELKYFSRR